MENSEQRAGTIVSIQLCPGYRKPMETVERSEVIEDLGLKGDRHARAGSARQVLLLEKETLDALQLEPGEAKENITTSGIPLMTLRAAQQLRLGEEVLLEITKPCAPCSRMEELRPGLLRAFAGRRGMLARVLRGGTIRTGDTIELLGE